MSKKIRNRTVLVILLVLVGIQFIRPSRKVPRVDPNSGFEALATPPAEAAQVIQTACYDCHSYQTRYPWYAGVAPVSWWIASHVSEGREHLNFSDWGKYTVRERIKLAEESAEEVQDGHMPERTYTWMHGGARLTAAQRTALVAYFEELRDDLRNIPPMPPMPAEAPLLNQ